MKYEFQGRTIYPVVEVYHDAAVYLGGVSMREYFLEAEKCAAAQKRAELELLRLFGDLPVRRGISGPPNSYGHLICLGCPVEYPLDGEPNITPLFSSLEEGIAGLQELQDLDFSAQPVFKHYLALNACLQRHFPDETIPAISGLNAQGPLTSAVLLRGPDFILDIMDNPEGARLYLKLLTDSIVKFRRYRNRINGDPEVNPVSSGLADDLASLLAPSQWPDFVLPAWDQLLSGTGSGTQRNVHCENLSPAHLKHLETIGITHYQPSVSDQLTIENIRANTSVPFDWLLYSYHVTEMSDQQIQEWVDATVEAGIVRVRTQFGAYAVQADKIDRIHAFYKAFDKYRVE